MSNIHSRRKLRITAICLVLLSTVACFVIASAALGATYSVQAYGAKGDGVTNDTVAIQNAINAAQAAGGGTVYFPSTAANTYLLNSVYPSIHPWMYQNLLVGSGVTLQGDPASHPTLLQGPNGRQLVTNIPGAQYVINTIVAVGNGIMYQSIEFQNPSTNGGFYNLNACIANNKYVTLSNPSDTAHFHVGDYICFYEYTTGDVLPSQANQVTAVNANTGQLSLLYPVSRSFSTPSIANVTAVATHDVGIQNLNLQGGTPLVVTETFNFSATNCRFVSDTSIGGSNLYGCSLNTLTNYVFANNWFGSINGPYIGQELCQRNSEFGLLQSNVFNNICTGFGEYAAHLKMVGNTFNLYPTGYQVPALGIGGLDIDFTGNIVNSTNVDVSSGWGAVITDINAPAYYYAYCGKIRIVRNTINGQADNNNMVVLVGPDTVFAGNTVNIAGGNATGIHAEGDGQNVDIEGNTINSLSPAPGTGILLVSWSTDAAWVINNTITGNSGWSGIFIPYPTVPALGGYTIYGNSISGYTYGVNWDPSNHPGTITTGCVVNPGFEYESLSPGWRSLGLVKVADYTNAHTGSHAAYVTGRSQITQHLTGLQPDTTYTLTAWVKCTPGGRAQIEVRNYGGVTRYVPTAARTYSRVTLTFKTGWGSTAADIYAKTVSGSFYFDDCFVQ